LIAALGVHIKRYNGAATLDAYLTTLNAGYPNSPGAMDTFQDI